MRSSIAFTLAVSILLLALLSMPIASATLTGAFWPIDIALDNDGNIYAIASGNTSVQDFIHVYAPDGREVRTIGYSDRSPQEIAFDGDGNYYVRDTHRFINQTYLDTILKVNQYGHPHYLVTVNRSENFIINGLAVGRDGTVYYSKYPGHQDPVDAQYSDASYIFAYDTNWTTRIVHTADSNTCFTSLAVDTNGTVYACDFGGFVTVVYPDGNVSYIGRTGSTGRHGAFSTLVSVDIGQDGYLYACESSPGSVNRVRKLGTDGTPIAQWDGCGPYAFAGPRSVAADANGRVYVADISNQRIVWLTDDYRFGDNVTQNMAGEGTLWGTVVFSGYDNGTWAAMVQRENDPGLPYPMMGGAFIGIVIASIVAVALMKFYAAGKSFSRAGNALVIGIAAIVVTAAAIILIILSWYLLHIAFGYGYVDPLDRYLSAAEGSQLYSLFIVVMLAAGAFAAHVGGEKIKGNKDALMAGGLTGLGAACTIFVTFAAILIGQQLLSYGPGSIPAFIVSEVPGMILLYLLLPAAFAMPIAAAGAFITRRYATNNEGIGPNGPRHDLMVVAALAVSIVLVTLITADFSSTYNLPPIAPVLFLLPLLVTLPMLASGFRLSHKAGPMPPGFAILALSAVAIIVVPVAEVLIASAIGII